MDSRVQSTIGAVVLLVNPLPPSGIPELIGLDPDEVKLFLTLVQSLLILDEDPTLPIKPFHKSFPDFITDPLSRLLGVAYCWGVPRGIVFGLVGDRSEERRVGKECHLTCRSRWSPDH